MNDLIVVGGGYWGVAAALFAERRGAKVLMIEAASRAASGHFSFGWYCSEPWKTRIKAAFDAALSFDIGLRQVGAVGHRRNKPPVVREDWWTFDPAAFLALRKPNIVADVFQVAPGAVHVVPGIRYEARRVLVAAGVWTDDLLRVSGFAPLGLTSLPGTGLVVFGNVPEQVAIHHINPYRHYAIRQWGPGLARVGETLEQKPNERAAYVSKLATTMLPYFSGGITEVARLSGQRPMLQGGPVVREVAPGVVVATGGGRMGGVSSFWGAAEACRLLEVA